MAGKPSDPKKRARTKAAFLKAYRETCRVDKALESVDVSKSTIYEWRAKDEKFKAAFDEVREVIACTLEDEAFRRAYEGTMKPTAHGPVREYSDTLCIFLLKALNPERYRERYDVKSDNTVRTQGQVTIYMPDNGREPNKGE